MGNANKGESHGINCESLSTQEKKKWIFGKTGKISNDYTLGAQLGLPGQFGYASLATHKETNKSCAVKVIRKGSFHPSQFDSFRREFAIIMKINHPNIIKGIQYYETKSLLYLVMECCEGGELFDRIKQRAHYSERDAQVVLKQLVEATAYMHSHKIAHCDLKPDNILFSTDDERSPIKIIDFGMSKHLEKRQHLSTVCGTSFYMAPEVLKGNYTEDCDVWSVGVIMFIMLFGFPPFHGDSDSDIYRAIRKGFRPETMDTYGPCFPADIPATDAAKDLIAKMLESDPIKRISAAEALQHPWLTGEAACTNNRIDHVLHHLDQFVGKFKLKKALLASMTSTLGDAELKAIKQSFKDLDTNKDGMLSFEELKDGIKNGKITQSEQKVLQTAMSCADVDGDGKLSYEELLMACVQNKLAAKEDRLYQMFCELDGDGNGFIEAAELEKLFEANPEVAGHGAEMIAELDKDGDGLINYDEFLHMFMDKERTKNDIAFKEQYFTLSEE